MQFTKLVVLTLAPLALATEQHRNITAAMAMSEGLFDPVFTFLSPLMANAAASKGIEEKFGPMVAKILNSQYDILYALYILGRCVPCTRGAIKKPDPEKFKADDALPPTGEDTRVGGGKATGGLTGGVTGGIGGII